MIITELQDLMNAHISPLLSLSDFKWHKMTESDFDAKLGKENKFSLAKEVLQMFLRLLTHWLQWCLGSDVANEC